VVLSEQGSRQHVGQVFHGIPCQILLVGQNKCPTWKNIKFPTEHLELTTTSRAHLDAAAGGAYLDLTVAKATALIEYMVSNQGWNEERSQPKTTGGMHIVKEMDMLVA